MLKKGLTKQILLSIVLVCFISTTASAGRDWAPGISGKQINKTSKPKGSSNIWLRFGPSLGNFEQGNTMVGIKLEFGIRPIVAEKDAKYQWSLELPFEISGYQEEFSIDDFMFLGQFIPTGRVAFATKSGMVVSPFLGFGGGMILMLDSYLDDNFIRIMTLRLGCDLMFNKSMGIAIGYNKSSMNSSYNNGFRSEDIDIKFNQLTFSFIYHP